MLDLKPGNLVLVSPGVLIQSIVNNESYYNDIVDLAIIVSTTPFVWESDDRIEHVLVTVFIGSRGLFVVDGRMLLDPQGWSDPGKLLPPVRL